MSKNLGMSFKQEGEPFFNQTAPAEGEEKETPPESSTEDKPAEEPSEQATDKPSQEGGNTPVSDQVPWHKDPRWQEVYAQAKLVPELQQELASLRSQKIEAPPANDIPDWFKYLYGDNQEAWSKYSSYETQLRTQIRQEALEEISNQTRAQQEEMKYYETWVDNQLTSLKSEGKSFDQNELLKVVKDWRPTDAEGNLDFKKAYDILQLTKSKDGVKNIARKKLAAELSSDSKGEPAERDYVTSADIRKQGGFRGVFNK